MGGGNRCNIAGWCRPIEMVFEGVTALNLRPAKDNYSAGIFEASFFVKDAAVFFCDERIAKFIYSFVGRIKVHWYNQQHGHYVKNIPALRGE